MGRARTSDSLVFALMCSAIEAVAEQLPMSIVLYISMDNRKTCVPHVSESSKVNKSRISRKFIQLCFHIRALLGNWVKKITKTKIFWSKIQIHDMKYFSKVRLGITILLKHEKTSADGLQASQCGQKVDMCCFSPGIVLCQNGACSMDTMTSSFI